MTESSSKGAHEAGGTTRRVGGPRGSLIRSAAAPHRSLSLASVCRTIDLIDIPITILDLEGRIRHLNPANERLLGRKDEELRGQPSGVFLPAGLRDRSAEWLATLLERGTLRSVSPNERADGTVIQVEVTAQVVRSPDGEARWILAAVHDLGPQLAQLGQFNASALSVLTASGEDLLVEIVRVARELVGARYAALGVVEDGVLLRFIPDGMSETQISGIDHWPEGRGLLGAMITERRTIRTPEIRSDPRSSGFPPGHPPMRSFLGTPISTADGVYGHLYFTDKVDASEFNALDEHLAELFAAHAAIAIRDRRRRDELTTAARNLAEAQRIAHIGSWERDLATGVLRWSDESYRIMGLEPGTFAGTVEAFLAFVHPDDRAKAAPSPEALAEGAPTETRYRIIRPDGTVRVLHEFGDVVRDAAGRPVRFTGATQDITEQVELEAQQTRLARLLDELASEIYIFDAETLRFSEANTGAQRNIGYSIDELLGLTPLDLKPEFTFESFRAMLAPLLAGERAQVAFDTIHRRKDGSTYPVEVRVHFLPSETPAVFVAIVQDITERVAGEAERARLASAVEQTADLIMITDPSGTIAYVNSAFERMSGYARDEVVGENPRILRSGQHDAEFHRAMWTTLLAGRPWSGSLVNRRRDGGLYAVETTISPVLGAAGELTGFVEVGRDVTRERALESALERDTREREMIRAALERIDPAASPEEIIAAACAELIRLADIESAWAVELTREHGRILAVEGLVANTFRPGQLLPSTIVRYLLDRASAGPWAEDWRARPEDGAFGEEVSATGLRSAAYAPLVGTHGTVGLMGFGTHNADRLDRVVEALPALATFGSIVGALVVPKIEARHREAEARAGIQAILDDRGFAPSFQPIIDLGSGAVLGYEALTRFSDGRRPDLAFAAAVQAGLGIDLEVATLTAAIEAAQAVLPSVAYLSLNVSPGLIHSGHLGRLLAGQKRRIVLEITEHVAISDYSELRRELTALGPTVGLAVDDAGAGYASFRHILELAPESVKLDIGLVRGIDVDQARQALIAGMSYFAVKRKIHLIAEGIETSAELETLRSLGVHIGQGFLLGRPRDGRAGGPWPTRVAVRGLQPVR